MVKSPLINVPLPTVPTDGPGCLDRPTEMGVARGTFRDV